MNEPTRQIHLDFHTSGNIPGIGSEFSKEQFQKALKLGRVNLINVFAKCHHSWSYYPTSIGMPHPDLVCGDLLGEQIRACHEIGVTAPIYFTVGWSAQDAEDHPEWCMRRNDGGFVTGANEWPTDALPTDPKPTFQWKQLCIATGYRDIIRAQTEEICRIYPVDGFWYDIYQAHELCYCDTCRAGMEADGLDVGNTMEVEAYRAKQILAQTAEIKDLILSQHPEASVYFNGLTNLDRAQNIRYRLYAHNTKNDLEDLPTTWGGYDKFPIRSKVFHKEKKPIVAMSGKFHTAWGEFGGFKDPEAIRFEAAAMIAYGARCNIGDQLHPSGIMDMTTYANIGHAFEYVEKIEEYGIDGLPVSTLGVWLIEDMEAMEGLCRMLLEEQIDFDIVRPGDTLDGYETLIVPSQPGVLSGHDEAISRFVNDGGSVLVLSSGILDAGRSTEAIACGATFVGEAESDMDFTLPGSSLREGAESAACLRSAGRLSNLPATPFLNYTAGLRFSVDDDTEVLAEIREPYFSRTYGKYCGHQNTPNRIVAAEHPAVFRSGNMVVSAHPLDRMYFQHGAKLHRSFFSSMLRLLHTSPLVEVALPSAGRVSLLHQRNQSRYVAHILYGAPIERGRCSVIEDLPTFSNVDLVLRLPVNVKRMMLVPVETDLGFEVTDAARSDLKQYTTTIPSFSAHCAVVAEY